LIPRRVGLLLLALLLGAAGCTTIAPQWFPPPYQPPVPTWSLTITKAGAGAGNGTVTAPPGINCGATCVSGYANGAVVSLTATATAPASFSAWSGACTATGTTCTVTMSTSKTVTATFVAGDTIPPPAAGQPTIGTPTLGSTTATFPTTWTASIDQPSNTPVPTYNWSAGYNDGAYSTSGTTTTASLSLVMPYAASGAATSGYLCVVAVDASGNAAPSSCNGVSIPANPDTSAKLTAAWTAPTQNTDGSALTDLTSYRVYYGRGTANPCRMTTLITVPAPTTSVPLTGLANGVQYTATITAINSAGQESACPTPVSGTAHP
jgi:hypothetical protein